MITNLIQLDFNKENDLKVPSVQYDSGSRFVKIKLQRNKNPFKIDGYRVTVVANKVDGTEIMNDCTILDGVNGVVQFEITEQFNAVEGVVDCQLKLFKGKTLLTSMPFSINVVKSVSTKEIVSSNELKTLVNALGEVQDIDNRFAQTNAQLSNIGFCVGTFKNDTNTWSDALELCLESAIIKGGGVLFFRYGTYELERDFVIESNVVIDFNNAKIKSKTGKTLTITLKGDNIKIINGDFEDIQIAIGVTGVNQNNVSITDNKFNKYDRAIHNYASDRKIQNLYIERNVIVNQKNEECGAIQPFCAIGFHGHNVEVESCRIKDNTISNTRAFGIQFYLQKNSKYSDVEVNHNFIENTGINIPINNANFSGSGGIYSGGYTGTGVRILNNTLKHINEVGIEGNFYEVTNNYIEDTGCDALNRYIGDNSCIYGNSQIISKNTLVNPGNSGAIKLYSTSDDTEVTIIDNIIINKFSKFEFLKQYVVGDLVVSDNKWYKCVKGGISGEFDLTGKSSNITNGTCMWDYKKDVCESGINITCTKKPKKMIIIGNSLHDYSQPLYCTLGDMNYYKFNKITYDNIAKIKPTLITSGISNSFEMSSDYNIIRLNDYFEEWDSDTKTKNFSNLYGNVEQYDGSMGRKLPKIKNTNSNGSGISSKNFYTEEVCNIVITIRFKTNNGIHLRYIDSSGWRMNQVLSDNSEDWVTKTFVSYTTKPREEINKIEIYNMDKSDTTGNNYVIVDWIKVEEII